MGNCMPKNYAFKKVLEPVYEQIVSAETLLSFGDERMGNIERIEFRAPKIGDDNFGKFKIRYKTPMLCEVGR